MSLPRSAASFDVVPGFSRFYMDYAARRLPGTLDNLRRPEVKGLWSEAASARLNQPLDPGLAQALRVEHRRLLAGPESLRNLDLLAGGRAVAVLTGQQPGLFGGPMHTRLKVITAAALARIIGGRLDLPVVPVFWIGSDDADFDEVAHASLPGRDLSVARFSVPSAERVPRSWVGDLPGPKTLEVLRQADGLLGEAGGGGAWQVWRESVREQAKDFGDWMALQYLDWFRADGLVVIDARLPELRRAAAGLFRRYLDQAPDIERAVTKQGEAMELEGYPPQIDVEQARAAFFLTPARQRLKAPAEEVLAEAGRLLDTHPGDLSPNVVLRPLVSDTVLPSIAQVVGPSELVYHAQLGPAYERLLVHRPVIVDRLSMTLVPPVSLEVARDLGIYPSDLLADPRETFRKWYEARVPEDLARALAGAGQKLQEAFAGLRGPAGQLDSSLGQQIDSALEKSLFQLSRLVDGVLKKVKHQSELASPARRHAPDFLAPRGRLQERELAALTLDLPPAAACREAVMDLALEHLNAVLEGRREHFLVPTP